MRWHGIWLFSSCCCCCCWRRWFIPFGGFISDSPILIAYSIQPSFMCSNQKMNEMLKWKPAASGCHIHFPLNFLRKSWYSTDGIWKHGIFVGCFFVSNFFKHCIYAMPFDVFFTLFQIGNIYLKPIRRSKCKRFCAGAVHDIERLFHSVGFKKCKHFLHLDSTDDIFPTSFFSLSLQNKVSMVIYLPLNGRAKTN